MPGEPGVPGIPLGPGVPAAPGVPGAPGIPGMPGSEGSGGTCVPLTDTSTSNPSSPSSALDSPSEPDGPLSGRPPVGIESPRLPEDEAVAPGLELLDPELLELDELDVEGIEGLLELELDDDDEGIDGIDEDELELDEDELLLELELELDDVGIDGVLELLLWLVCVWQAANTRLSADTVSRVRTEFGATCLFILYLCRGRDLCFVPLRAYIIDRSDCFPISPDSSICIRQ